MREISIFVWPDISKSLIRTLMKRTLAHPKDIIVKVLAWIDVWSLFDCWGTGEFSAFYNSPAPSPDCTLQKWKSQGCSMISHSRVMTVFHFHIPSYSLIRKILTYYEYVCMKALPMLLTIKAYWLNTFMLMERLHIGHDKEYRDFRLIRAVNEQGHQRILSFTRWNTQPA